MNEVKTTAFRPGVLVQRLREIQNARGYLPNRDVPGEDDLHRLANELGVPLYRIQEVASFFPHFRIGEKPSQFLVQICRDMSCHLAGMTSEIIDAWNQEFREKGYDITIEGVSCLGRCDRAPVMLASRHDHENPENAVHEAVFGRHELALKKQGIDAFEYLHRVIDNLVAGAQVTNDVSEARATGKLLADADATFPVHRNLDWLIDVYQEYKLPPYSVTKKYLRENPDPIWPFIEDKIKEAEMKKEDIRIGSNEDIQRRHKNLYQLSIAQLLGMGGAGAPAFKKWTDVWNSSEDLIRSGNVDYIPEKYIVCNGDESEPGTFKDRELLLRKPHLVVEGVILAGLMLNCKAGYIYVRHEYIEGIEALKRAIADAEREGVIGEKLAASKRDGGYERQFTVEVFVSPGGYICGEQGALLEAMSDRRGQPRPRPPEPQANGLNDKPTVVNNVETLSWIPAITHLGGTWYRDSGYTGAPNIFPLRPDEKSMYKGRRLFSISGDVRKPGVYEVPIGMPLKEVLYSPEYCGGMLHDGAELYAIAPSGPSSGFLPRQLPHDSKSVDDQIRRYKEGLEIRMRQNKLIDELLLIHKQVADDAKKNIEKIVGFVLEASNDQFKKMEMLKEQEKKAPTDEEKKKAKGELWQLIEGGNRPKTKIDYTVVPYVAPGNDSELKIKPKRDERKSPPIADKVAKKRTEWETKDDLNRRILYTLEQLKANNFHIDELPLDLNVFRNLPSPLKVNIDILLGGGFVIYDSTRKKKMLSEAVNLTSFFANESCGKCVPCRLGSEKLVILGTELLDKKRKLDKTRKLVDELGFAMKQTSICSLGTSAPNPLYSLMEAPQFREVEFDGLS